MEECHPRSTTTKSSPMVQIDPETGYFVNINEIRRLEYPTLSDTIYLDYAGAPPHANCLIDLYAEELKSNLMGNPHSFSASSQLSTKRIDEVRLQVLRYLKADPDEFDIIFVSNATAAIKLVATAFQDLNDGFNYRYHSDAHTSLVGVRSLARNGNSFIAHADIPAWLSSKQDLCSPNKASKERADAVLTQAPELFAYPGQSNMTGQRYPFDWCSSLRRKSIGSSRRIYTLYDAAALLPTCPLDLSDAFQAPDFIALSFYKVFGFPDLGALVVRKKSGAILRQRKYFGGGTVDLVDISHHGWHAKKEQLHSSLEDGTLPFHTIIALDHALKTHRSLFGEPSNISRHVHYLVSRLYEKLQALRHDNGRSVCQIYSHNPTNRNLNVGPIVTFNLIDADGSYISNSEVEKLAYVRGIQVRTGGLCNPGGTAEHLDLNAEQLKKNYDGGQRCGGNVDILDGKPTGTIRVSLGATSSLEDVDQFLAFVADYYIERSGPKLSPRSAYDIARTARLVIESISIFPIKSCGGFEIPRSVGWEVLPQGLKWDREWCLVHQGTNVAISQKQFPRMALLQPTIDLTQRILVISYESDNTVAQSICIDIDEYPEAEGVMATCDGRFKQSTPQVCGIPVLVHLYTSEIISEFFSQALGVPCTLARYPQNLEQRSISLRRPTYSPESSPERRNGTDITTGTKQTIKLSNESPILLISTASVAKLNEQIEHNHNINRQGTKDHAHPPQVTPATFRGNIIVKPLPQSLSLLPSSSASLSPNSIKLLSAQATDPNQAYIEESFSSLRVIRGEHNYTLTVLGPCQRCQMICIEQSTAKRRQEPFSTLAKTRRKNGRVWFGMHLCLDDRPSSAPSPPSDRNTDSERRQGEAGHPGGNVCFIKVGDLIEATM